MKGSKTVVGVFGYMDDLCGAIGEVRKSGLDFKVYSPVPNHAIDEAVGGTRSPIRYVTFCGAVAGLIGGFALAIWTSLDYPLRTSAKSVTSIPAFVVIGYECTILLGALSTFAALFFWARLPFLGRRIGYDPRFSYDKFGLVVGCEKGDLSKVESLLQGSGAEEVEIRDGL